MTFYASPIYATVLATFIMVMLNVVRPAIIEARAKAWGEWITGHYPFSAESSVSRPSLASEAWSSLTPGAGKLRILTFGSSDGFMPCTLATGE